MGLMARPEELSFLFGGNAVFIAELYSRYVEDPDSVDPSWKSFFDDLRDDPAGTLVEARGPSWGRLKPSVIRSEARRVGKECVSTCRSWWSPYTLKKTKHNNT